MSKVQQLKATIRQSIRTNRNSLSLAYQQQSGQRLAEQITQSGILQDQHDIACFLSFDNEIPTLTTIESLFSQNKRCYLPKLRHFKPNRLWFMPYHKASQMIDNRYGIAEVDLPINRAIAVSQLDVVLLPLVAFDRQCNRMGMGGGYYDATFAHLRNKAKRPVMVGLAYELQLVDTLPCERWDLPLDAVVTESNIYYP
jgi:5-formyltetrahydrofolate cyclo-ligase